VLQTSVALLLPGPHGAKELFYSACSEGTAYGAQRQQAHTDVMTHMHVMMHTLMWKFCICGCLAMSGLAAAARRWHVFVVDCGCDIIAM
jgi:hypothetical protein